jgi:formate dehydrogenase major subunit
MAGGAALATTVSPVMMKKATAATAAGSGNTQQVKTICTHCSVGCGIIAEVQNGVWTGQEPAFDHPFNKGAHCAKGASIREHGHGERRLKYPTKLVNGKWQKISWEQAINEIGDKLMDIRKTSGPDSVYWLGSASTVTSRHTCSASSPPCGEPITSTTRRASAIRPRSQVLPIPGVTAR